MYPINVKTVEPIGPKVVIVYGPVKLNRFAQNKKMRLKAKIIKRNFFLFSTKIFKFFSDLNPVDFQDKNLICNMYIR